MTSVKTWKQRKMWGSLDSSSIIAMDRIWTDYARSFSDDEAAGPEMYWMSTAPMMTFINSARLHPLVEPLVGCDTQRGTNRWETGAAVSI